MFKSFAHLFVHFFLTVEDRRKYSLVSHESFAVGNVAKHVGKILHEQNVHGLRYGLHSHIFLQCSQTIHLMYVACISRYVVPEAGPIGISDVVSVLIADRVALTGGVLHKFVVPEPAYISEVISAIVEIFLEHSRHAKLAAFHGYLIGIGVGFFEILRTSCKKKSASQHQS